MAKQPKWDTSESIIIEIKSNGNKYVWQVVYNNNKYNESFDTDIKGYYFSIMSIDITNPDDPKGYVLNPLWSDVRLLIPTERRGEKQFNKALEMAEELLPRVLQEIENDREELLMKGIDEKELNEIMKRYNDEMRERYEGANRGYKEFKETHPPVMSEPLPEPVEEKKVEKKKKGVCFEDVAGLDEVKEILLDVVDQLKNPEKYAKFDIKPMRSLLLYSVPGCGKTLVANAFSNEIDAEFKKISLSTVGSKYQNESSKNIKRIFDEARESNKFVVLFFDECDSISAKRGTDENSKEKNNTMNTLLEEMSSDNNDNLFMIFATNFYEALDPAFKRKGRISVTIEIPLPDFNTRLEILKINTRRKPLADDVDLEYIAKEMNNKNCADMADICDKSARRALKKGKDVIEQEDFLEELEKITNNKKEDKRKIGFTIN